MSTISKPALLLERVEVHVEFMGQVAVTARDLSELLDFLSQVADAINPRARVGTINEQLGSGERVAEVFGTMGLVERDARTGRLVVDALHYGSPFRLTGAIRGMSAETSRAFVGFFKHLIFYEQEKARRNAETALIWEQVVAAKIDNLRALASLGVQGVPSALPEFAVEQVAADITRRTGELLRLSSTFEERNIDVLHVSAGHESLNSEP